MNFDELQKTWQAQDPGAKVTLDADGLLREVRRNQRHFQATILWRDVREVGVAFLLTLFFSYHGWRHQDWTDGLVGLACLGVGTFMVVDRLVQRRKQPVPTIPSKAALKARWSRSSTRSGCLKNVFWWYLLPLAVALAIGLGYSTWHNGPSASAAIVSWTICVLVVALVNLCVYWLNQFAVRKTLEPRRQELETLLTSLKENSRPVRG